MMLPFLVFAFAPILPSQAESTAPWESVGRIEVVESWVPFRRQDCLDTLTTPHDSNFTFWKCQSPAPTLPPGSMMVSFAGKDDALGWARESQTIDNWQANWGTLGNVLFRRHLDMVTLERVPECPIYSDRDDCEPAPADAPADVHRFFERAAIADPEWVRCNIDHSVCEFKTRHYQPMGQESPQTVSLGEVRRKVFRPSEKCAHFESGECFYWIDSDLLAHSIPEVRFGLLNERRADQEHLLLEKDHCAFYVASTGPTIAFLVETERNPVTGEAVHTHCENSDWIRATLKQLEDQNAGWISLPRAVIQPVRQSEAVYTHPDHAKSLVQDEVLAGGPTVERRSISVFDLARCKAKEEKGVTCEASNWDGYSSLKSDRAILVGSDPFMAGLLKPAEWLVRHLEKSSAVRLQWPRAPRSKFRVNEDYFGSDRWMYSLELRVTFIDDHNDQDWVLLRNQLSQDHHLHWSIYRYVRP